MGKKHKQKKHKERRHDEEFAEERIEKEPLKLVLKVGNHEPSPDVYSRSSYDGEKRHKHKKKKKKKSSERDREHHKHHGEEKSRKRPREEEDGVSVSQEDEEVEETYEPPAKKPILDLDLLEESNDSQELPATETRGMAKEEERGILKQGLLYIHKTLQKKDINGFFAYPVNDMIAPGYSSIIRYPIDFSTMKIKIDSDQYEHILEYKRDFVQMCNNAMTYNRPETIYYKEAKRLLHSGMKMMSKDKLISMKRNLGFLCSITMEELGVDKPDDTGAVVEAIAAEELEYQKKAKARDSIGRYEAFPDNMSPEEILAQAKAAAKEAADMLTLREPQSKLKRPRNIEYELSFLRRRQDGTTSLRVLNPDSDGILNETERVINIGALVGKLGTGTGSIAGYKEDKRNKVTPMNYLNYGPFSSHAPLYDSSFSNASKEDSDLLLSTYGDEVGVQYAKSVSKFVEDAEEDCTTIVDSLLDVLTKGQHSKTMKKIRQKKDEEDKKKTPETLASQDKKSTELVGVSDSQEKDEMQEGLDKNASLLQELQKSQYERLSQKLPSHLAHVQSPSEKEHQLADKVTKGLTELAKKTIPQNVLSVKGLRDTIGISLEVKEGEEDREEASNVPDRPIKIEDQTSNQSYPATDTATEMEVDNNQYNFSNNNQDVYSMNTAINEPFIDNL